MLRHLQVSGLHNAEKGPAPVRSQTYSHMQLAVLRGTAALPSCFMAALWPSSVSAGMRRAAAIAQSSSHCALFEIVEHPSDCIMAAFGHRQLRSIMLQGHTSLQGPVVQGALTGMSKVSARVPRHMGRQ